MHPHRHTEITSTPNSPRWEDSLLISTLEELQPLGKQRLQDQPALCQVVCRHHWSVPTRVFLAYYCSLEGDVLSPPLSTSHNCQGLSRSGGPSTYKTEYYWEGSPNFVTILKANELLQGFQKIKKGEEREGGRGNQAVSNPLVKYGGSGWKIWLSCRTGVSWAAIWRDKRHL